MSNIVKPLGGGEKLTSKQRVRTTLANGVPDRVPINYGANPGIDGRLKEHFGLAPDDWEGLRQILGVDFRAVGAPHKGTRLHAEVPDRHVDPRWGVHTRYIAHDTGGYWDYCDFPLRDADEAAVAAWPMPSPNDYDYSNVAAACRAKAPYAVHVGNPGLGCVMNTAGFLRTMDQMFVDLITDDPAGLLLIKRRMDIEFEVARRVLEAAEGGIDFLWMGEDLGTQHSPLISMDLFRKHIKPYHQRLIDLADSHGIPVMIHTCGSSSWTYEEYIAMGMSAVDTLQPEAKNMSPAYLKRTFGGRLAFHGCISTAGPVADGTVEDTVAICSETLDIMMPGGGYCFAPTHELQDNSPTENVVAMYETAHRLGHYN